VLFIVIVDNGYYDDDDDDDDDDDVAVGIFGGAEFFCATIIFLNG